MTPTVLRIDLRVTPYLNLPLWNNQVPPIQRLRLTNEGAEELADLTLTIDCVPEAFPPLRFEHLAVRAEGWIDVPTGTPLLNYALLKSLQEGAPAEITVRATDREGIEIARMGETIRLLPASHWGGSLAVPEMLAAHVFPNDPAVAPLLRRASELLAADEQLLQLDGYQSGIPRNAAAQAIAVFTAIAAANVHYVNPPSSFEITGQKVRTPGEMIGDGLATCLDLVVLGAAVLEQAGLHPVMIMLRGHAYLACWLQESSLSTGIIEDAQVLRKALRNKLLLGCETTLLTGEQVGVSKATTSGAGRIESSEDFLFAIDLAAARSGERIRPFTLAETETFARAERAPSVSEGLDLSGLEDVFGKKLGEAVEEEMVTGARRVAEWKNQLLDLSRRNKLLNWRPTGGAMHFEYLDAAELEDKLADGSRLRFEAIDGRRGGSGTAARQLDAGHYAPAIGKGLSNGKLLIKMPEGELHKNLLNLERKSRNSLEEGGANTLFFALGFTIKTRPGQQSRFRPLASGSDRAEYIAPLILLPVDIRRKRAGKAFTLVARDEDALLNPTLLEFLKQETGLEFPRFDRELPTDESGIDVPGIFQYVRQKLLNVPGWELVSEVALGEFSFAKYLMWRDLDAFEEHLRDNALVAHLIDTPRQPYRKVTGEGGQAFPRQVELDQTFPVAEMLTPMSADSSQLVAIRAASQGMDFVLEGPPGTGKSQTITNLIAQCLGEGKTVLFVSEKTAALEVVHRRLQSVGLGDACLELHSNKISKSYVYGQLKQAVSGGAESGPANDFLVKAGELGELRRALNDQVDALHIHRDCGISVYAAVAQVATHADLEVPVPTGVGQLSAEDLATNRQTIRKLSALLRDVQPGARTALSAFSGPVKETEFKKACEELIQCVTELTNAAQAWAVLSTDLESAAHREDHHELSLLADLLLAAEGNDYSTMSILIDNGTARRKMRQSIETFRKLADHFNKLKGSYRPQVGEAPAGRLSLEWQESTTKWVLVRMYKQWKLKKALAPYVTVPVTEPGADLRQLAVIQELYATLPSSITGGFKLSKQYITTTVARLNWTERLINFGDSGWAEVLGIEASQLQNCLQRIAREGKEGRELLSTARTYLAALAAARQAVIHWRGLLGRHDATQTSSDEPVYQLLGQEAETQIVHQRDWRAYGIFAAERKAARTSGLAYFIDSEENGLEESSEAAITRYNTGVCRAVATYALANDPKLQRFSSTHFEELLEKFRALDEQFAAVTTGEVQRRLQLTVKDAYRTENRVGMGILHQEISKKRSQMPVRQLIKALGSLLPELKPCFMMSPLSIAQYLPPDGSVKFDVVVFDEASQIPVWDAIGAIARGKQAIIVGDSKQLPPTNFFSKQSGEETDYVDEEDYHAETMESILDEMKAAQVPSWRLRWHYRSRAESLIAFSNRTYYNSDLNTFPAPLATDRAVGWHKVESRGYLTGRNEIEARALVKYLIDRLATAAPDALTFGVVTFNQAQQTLIQDLLEKERIARPLIERHFAANLEEPLFVKNIESVQGDERDVILFSVTYGPDETGQVKQRFGPMNQVGGERRLNVAVTRARREMQIFSSMEPEQIDPRRLGENAAGARDLRVFLSFAKQGPTAFAEQITSVGGQGEYDSPFERAVAEKLRLRGFETDPQVGVSGYRIDLGVCDPRHPGRYLAGVECDGASYHSTATARERDILRQSVLEGLGWNIVRVWSLDWWHDAERTADRLAEKLAMIRDKPTVEKELQPTPAPQEQIAVAVPESGTPSRPVYHRTTEEELVHLRQRAKRLADDDYTDPLYQEATQTITADMVRLIAKQEAPVLLDQLVRRIAVEGYGYSRTGSRITGIIEPLVRKHAYLEESHGDDLVWFKEEQLQDDLVFRIPDTGSNSDRVIAEVPLVELAVLAKEFIHGGLDNDELIRQMGALIGVKTVRGSSRDRVRRAIELAWIS